MKAFINGKDFTDNIQSFRIGRKLNQASVGDRLKIKVNPNETSLLKNQNDCEIYDKGELLIDGTLSGLNFKSTEVIECEITSNTEDKLMNASTPNNYRKTSLSASTIVDQLCSEGLDGSSPWIVETSTNDDTTSLDFRAEKSNRLSGLIELAALLGDEWWIRHDPQFTAGKLDGGVTFDADYPTGIRFGEIAVFNRTDAFSVSFWWKKSSSTADETIFSNYACDKDQGWEVIASSGKFKFTLTGDFGSGSASDEQVNVITDNAYDNGSWRHVVVTYDGSGNASGVTVYVDDSSVSTTTNYDTLSNDLSYSNSLNVGARAGRVNPADYILDDLRVYDSELSSSNVSSIYNSGGGTGASVGSEYLWCKFDKEYMVYDVAGANDLSFGSFNSWSSNSVVSSHSLDFSASDEYVSISGLSDFDSSTGSVNLWFNLDDDPVSDECLFSFSDLTTDDTTYFRFFLDSSSDTLKAEMVVDGVTKWVCESSTVSSFSDWVDSWTHVCLTQDGSSPVLYVNGSADTNWVVETDKSVWFTDLLNASDSANILSLGATANNASYSLYFDGLIDDARLWNKALSSSDVSSLYSKSAGLSDMLGGEVSYYPGKKHFHRIKDWTNNNNHGYWKGKPYMNFSNERSAGKNTHTFITYGNYQNSQIQSRSLKKDKLWNKVKVIGFGDGTEQIESIWYEDATSQEDYDVREKYWRNSIIRNKSEANNLASNILSDHKDPWEVIELVDFGDVSSKKVYPGETVNAEVANVVFADEDDTKFEVVETYELFDPVHGLSTVVKGSSVAFDYLAEAAQVDRELKKRDMQQINETTASTVASTIANNYNLPGTVGSFIKNLYSGSVDEVDDVIGSIDGSDGSSPQYTLSNGNPHSTSYTSNATTSNSYSSNTSKLIHVEGVMSGTAAGDTSYLDPNGNLDYDNGEIILAALVYNTNASSKTVNVTWADGTGDIGNSIVSINAGDIILVTNFCSSGTTGTVEVRKAFGNDQTGIRVKLIMEGNATHDHDLGSSSEGGIVTSGSVELVKNSEITTTSTPNSTTTKNFYDSTGGGSSAIESTSSQSLQDSSTAEDRVKKTTG